MVDSFFDGELILAAEDFPDDQFERFHTFSDYEDRIIRKLISHGPVLLRGGRGSGKSALLKESFLRIHREETPHTIFGIYLSLRHLPLLRSKGQEYERYFCSLLIDHVKNALDKKYGYNYHFDPDPEIGEVQKELTKLSSLMGRRIVLFFDDAAHIGRETSLKEFFDIFRTLSSNTISCKAAIYPGVTEFGTRFDLLNDASVIDIARSEESPSFTSFFKEIIQKRYSEKLPSSVFTKSVTFDDVATFLGRSVTGNVRAFIYACNHLTEIRDNSDVNLLQLEKTLKHLATEYYWPLLDELKPKLGSYEPLIEPTAEVAEVLFDIVSESMSVPNYGPSCLVHRDHVERLKKVFEMLEYVGFVVKREASRAMKSGGRGARYALNLCNLMERVSPNRLTSDMFHKWISHEKESSQIFRGGELDVIKVPDVTDSKDLGILSMQISVLEKSKAYPYGLTENKIIVLRNNGFKTVGDLADATDAEISDLKGIGSEWLKRIKNVVGQAIWM